MASAKRRVAASHIQALINGHLVRNPPAAPSAPGVHASTPAALDPQQMGYSALKRYLINEVGISQNEIDDCQYSLGGLPGLRKLLNRAAPAAGKKAAEKKVKQRRRQEGRRPKVEQPNSQEENRSRVNPFAAKIAAAARRQYAARDAAREAAEEAAANEPACVKQAREEEDALRRKKEIGRLLGALKGIYGSASQEPANTTAGSQQIAQTQHKVADEIFQAEEAELQAQTRQQAAFQAQREAQEAARLLDRLREKQEEIARKKEEELASLDPTQVDARAVIENFKLALDDKEILPGMLLTSAEEAEALAAELGSISKYSSEQRDCKHYVSLLKAKAVTQQIHLKQLVETKYKPVKRYFNLMKTFLANHGVPADEVKTAKTLFRIWEVAKEYGQELPTTRDGLTND